MQDLAALGYDAEWEVLSAAACGAPHLRERIFLVAYPHGIRPDREPGLLSALRGILGDNKQPFSAFNWAGIRIERAGRKAIRAAYCKPILYRVDNGGAGGLDRPAGVGRVSQEERVVWVKRLKALGNAITPHQSYAIAACILQAEGLPVNPRP